MLLGVWVMILGSQLGVPGFWKSALAVVTGLIIIFIAYKLRPDGSSRPPVPKSYIERHKEPRVESAPAPAPVAPVPPAVTAFPASAPLSPVSPVSNPNQPENS